MLIFFIKNFLFKVKNPSKKRTGILCLYNSDKKNLSDFVVIFRTEYIFLPTKPQFSTLDGKIKKLYTCFEYV